MKQIANFTARAKRGFYVDLADAPLSVAVNIVTGEILLHEGAGSDRLNNVRIPGEAVERFEVDASGGSARVVVVFRPDWKLESYLLGVTDQVDDAEAWVAAVNGVYDGQVDEVHLRRLQDHASHQQVAKGQPGAHRP